MDLGDNYFTVSPMNRRMEKLEPGQTYTGSITVTNPAVAKEDFYYSVHAAPYGVMGTDYQADLTTETGYTALSKWITIDESTGKIEPNHSKTVNYTIKVPDNAPAGGQYAAIIISKDPEASGKDGSSVAVNDIHEIASLIYADINGETTHKGEILDNQIPSFVMNPPINVGTMLSNYGNIHETATIYIKATDFFTGSVLVGLDEKGEEEYYTELVMPETERYITRSINNDLPQLGIVHVEQTIYYNGKQSKQERDVIICPVWFLVLLAATVGLTIFVIVRLVRRHKKKNLVV